MFRDTFFKCKDSFLFYTNLLYHTLIAHRERQMKYDAKGAFPNVSFLWADVWLRSNWIALLFAGNPFLLNNPE